MEGRKHTIEGGGLGLTQPEIRRQPGTLGNDAGADVRAGRISLGLHIGTM
jgi:hypothetical protein